MKRFYCLFAVLLAVVVCAVTAYALTAEEMLLLKRGGISEEKILEIQKKERATPTATKINPFDWNEDDKKDIIAGSSRLGFNLGMRCRVDVYLNKGTNLQPIFDKPTEINDIEIRGASDQYDIVPYVVDWDDDGKTDILVSNQGRTKRDLSTAKEDIIPHGIYLLLNTGTKEKSEFKELKEIKGKFRDDTVL